jgi:hypothetical protein
VDVLLKADQPAGRYWISVGSQYRKGAPAGEGCGRLLLLANGACRLTIMLHAMICLHAAKLPSLQSSLQLSLDVSSRTMQQVKIKKQDAG